MRRNADEDLRGLERSLDDGDESAGLRYVRELLSRDLLPDPWETYSILQYLWSAWSGRLRRYSEWREGLSWHLTRSELQLGKSGVEVAELALGPILRVSEGRRDPWETADRLVASGAFASRADVLRYGLRVARREALPYSCPATAKGCARFREAGTSRRLNPDDGDQARPNLDDRLRSLLRTVLRHPHDRESWRRLLVEANRFDAAVRGRLDKGREGDVSGLWVDSSGRWAVYFHPDVALTEAGTLGSYRPMWTIDAGRISTLWLESAT